MRAIVFVLRGCPTGWLGAYGNEWVGTPNLDRLAAEAVVFDRHTSDCPDPAAARAAWFGGRHQTPPIAVRAGSVSDGEVPPSLTLPARTDARAALRAAGVRSVLVRANHPDTDAAPHYYAGWDEVFDARPDADDRSPLDALIRALPEVLDKLANVPRFLLWVEIDRLVPPWDVRQDVFEAYVEDEDAEADDEPVPPFADPPTGPFDRTDPAAWEWLHRTFAAVVTTLDAELGAVFDELRTRGLDQTAAWLVTSDLGYPLGEHGQVGLHRPWLHEELVHLPLVLRLPAAAEAGRRVFALTQPADLFPTLLDLLGADPPAEPVHGHSLVPLATGKAAAVREYACSGLVLDGVGEWAIHTADRALLVPGPQPEADPPREPQLYEKPDDRWEVNDLRSRNVELAEQLEGVLRKYAAAVQHPGPLVVPQLANGPA